MKTVENKLWIWNILQ